MTTIVSQLGIAGLQTRFNAVLGHYVNIAREFPSMDLAVDAFDVGQNRPRSQSAGAMAQEFVGVGNLNGQVLPYQSGSGASHLSRRGSDVTLRTPIPSHRWRQEERHDQMGTSESD